MPTSKHRRKGRVRPRGKPPKMPPLPSWSEEDDIQEGDHPNVPGASDLLDWQPHLQREPDPRQGELFAH